MLRKTAILLVAVLGAAWPLRAEGPGAEVEKILERHQSLRPDDNDLAIYRLDWVSSLKEAQEKAAKEERPILLVVVTNSYGNVFTGHC